MPLVTGIDGPLARKKALLVVLAHLEAARLGLRVTAGELQSVVDAFRLRHGLASTDDMIEWLRSAGLDESEFAAAITDLTLVRRLEELYGDHIVATWRRHAAINELQRQHNAAPAGSLALDDGPDEWLQVNVSLNRRSGSALQSARALFADLAPAISEWRNRNMLQCFYFMRKPPDVRLRFRARAELDLLPNVEEVLFRLVRLGAIEKYFRSVYEPEVALFGGSSAMDQVHAYFDADSMAWIAFDALLASGRHTISALDLLRIALTDLFQHTVSGAGEVWDVWCNIASLAGRPEPMPPVDIEPYSIAQIARSINDHERQILRAYSAANRKMAHGLQGIWEQGQLDCGLRGILAYVAVFTANRHGLGTVLGAIADGMVLASDPRKHLSGGASEAQQDHTGSPRRT